MNIEIVAQSDKGLVREKNEDGFLINKQFGRDKGSLVFDKDDNNFIIAIADGVGGANAGEVASEYCLQLLSKCSSFIDVSRVDNDIKKIHSELIQYGKDHQQFKGLATTLAGIVYTPEGLLVFYVGDSRVYRFRQGSLEQVTKDHSLVQVLYESGQITKEQMWNHPEGHVILQTIGGKNPNIEPSIKELQSPLFDDIYLICSDGLSDLVPHDRIEELIGDGQALEETSSNLIEEAKRMGGTDNITVALMRKSKGGGPFE
ncbi:protein phosphatase 2C domain-containing protein [Evansella sp. LMS18]|uniref:PP2C family protein-serine/threonine phosphatase n=1 Tax=Evansella sp. LMS18 TaxID=2924033 RepID=UPI0020D0424C|nr:protein phosphatase 2C domain-containing protein [Evansella sp. LMS18]UTR12094.1 protein phosphatase 2C domain-containing protein [Evansella sp. LMS18]